MIVSLTLALLVLILPATAAAETGDVDLGAEKIAAIQELMEVTGVANVGANMSDSFSKQMITFLQTNYPDAPSRSFDVIKSEVDLVVSEELEKGTLQNVIYPIYAKYFSLEDIRGLIKFNKSPLGKKANQIMPRLMQESMQAGQVWGQELSTTLVERVTLKLKQEGIVLEKKSE